MDWDMPMTGLEFSSEPLTVETYRRTLQSPGAVYRALQMGSIAKPTIEHIFHLYPEHFGKLLRFAERQGIQEHELMDWITDYITWSEAEDFIER